MTLAELIAAYRTESFDTAKPPFVPDELAAMYANEAQTEAVRRSVPLRDSSLTASVAANEPVVPLDKKVLRIIRARLQSQARPLEFLTIYELDRGTSAWETMTGIPRVLVTDYQNGAVRLWPKPVRDEELLLTVERLPVKMETDTDEPEIREEHHRSLVNWMLYRAYSRQDADMFDPNKAAIALKQFESEFGARVSARNEEWMRQRHVTDAAPLG